MRCLSYALAVGVLSLAIQNAAQAASPAEMARCQTYAQKTVHQFELLSTHLTKCHVAPDPQWQPNYDFHYNGCLLFPAFMAQVGLAGRDAVLAGCGAFTDPPDSASPSPAVTPQQPAPSENAPPPATGAPPQNHKTAEECEFTPPPSFKLGAFTSQDPVRATRPAIAEGVLSFADGANNQKVSYRVQRPMFYRATFECQGIAHSNDLAGTWIWISDDGQQAKMFTLSATSVQVANLKPDVAREVLTQANQVKRH